MGKFLKNLDFRFMIFFYRFRDRSEPPKEILERVGIQDGDTILDYGSGGGSFTIAAAKITGINGKVYAADIQPLSSKFIRKKAAKMNLVNIECILTNCNTELQNESVDVVLFYDILHGLENWKEILTELHRVLKTEGTFSLSDHHLEEEEILSKMLFNNMFKLSMKNIKTFEFTKV